MSRPSKFCYGGDDDWYPPYIRHHRFAMTMDDERFVNFLFFFTLQTTIYLPFPLSVIHQQVQPHDPGHADAGRLVLGEGGATISCHLAVSQWHQDAQFKFLDVAALQLPLPLLFQLIGEAVQAATTLLFCDGHSISSPFLLRVVHSSYFESALYFQNAQRIRRGPSPLHERSDFLCTFHRIYLCSGPSDCHIFSPLEYWGRSNLHV